MFCPALRQELRNLWRWRELPVGPDELVLDVGSGENPHVRADVLCDAHLENCRERAGQFGLLIDGRPFVFADARRLPFRDQAFDFVICRHLLEHMADPQALLRELARVGKAGYIETPSPLLERLAGWPFHRLLVSQENGVLLVRSKEEDGPCGLFPAAIRTSPHYAALVDAYRDVFFTRHFWKGKIEYRVEGPLPPVSGEAPSESIRDIPPMTFRRRLRWTVTRLVRSFIARRRFSMESVLQCPSCPGEARVAHGRVVCGGCGKTYPVLLG